MTARAEALTIDERDLRATARRNRETLLAVEACDQQNLIAKLTARRDAVVLEFKKLKGLLNV